MRHSLQLRLAAFYSLIVFASGVVLLAIPLIGARSTTSVAAHATTQHSFDIHHLLIGSALAFGVLLPVSFGIGWLLAGRMLQPLRAMASAAESISATDLDRRLLPGVRDDELSHLGHILNRLFARLQAAFESQRQFVANASHELRTPLAGQRALIQVALDDPHASAATLRSTCEEMLTLGEQQQRLIDALLMLAAGQRGIEKRSTLDIADVTRTVLEKAPCGVDLRVSLAPAPTSGDPEFVASMVANLVDNAIRYNVPNGWVEVVVEMAGERAFVGVRNTGAVIPADEIERLFQPFQRLGNARSGHPDGHGLGLAIVRAIADAHGAALRAYPGPEGGLAVEVAFPGSP